MTAAADQIELVTHPLTELIHNVCEAARIDANLTSLNSWDREPVRQSLVALAKGAAKTSRELARWAAWAEYPNAASDWKKPTW